LEQKQTLFDFELNRRPGT